MASKALKEINLRTTPQMEQARPDQVKNNAGGYVFKLADEDRVHRFLTIGSEGGTFYTGERQLTEENAKVILDVAQSDRGEWLVEKIVELSEAGRTPKQDQLLFSLAAVAKVGNDSARRAALYACPKVARTGSTLLEWIDYTQQFGGWSRGLRDAVGRWFSGKDVEQIAYQMLKYRQRSGWSQRDLLRQAHPSIEIPSARALFNFIATGDVKTSRGPGGTERPVGASREDLPQLVEAFLEAQSATDVKVWTRLIAENPLSWEMLPDKAIGQAEVWKTLIRKGMPQTALQRQLPRLTRLGVLDDSEILSIVVAQLQDADKLRKGRVHPLNILVAQLTYASGQSLRGSSTWTPNVKVVDALDAAYYAAYKTLVPAGKKTLIALDLSGSMTWSNCSSLPVTPRVASAAMSLITLATEPNCDVTGFTGGWGRHGQTGGLTQLTLSPRQRLDDAVRYIQQQGAGGTDCSLPARWAREQGRDYETIVIYTDNETWAGPEQANQALRRYRDHVGHTVKQVVVGMTATDFTIADPRDRDSLDVAGFDSAAPNLIADFSRGDL